MTIPSRTVHYRSEATVTIRDRASNQPVAQETTSADFEDTISDYGLPEKWDRASGTALRLLEPKVASLISTRIRSLPPSPAAPSLPSISIPHALSPSAPARALAPASAPATVPAPTPAPIELLPRKSAPEPAQPKAEPAGGG